MGFLCLLWGIFYGIFNKSWHALFLPAIVFAYMVYRKILFKINWKRWIGFIVAGALPILFWVILRYNYDGTKFFTEMYMTDLFNRSTTVLESHGGDFFYYFRKAFQLATVSSLLPLLIGLIYGAISIFKKEDLPENQNFSRDFPILLLWFAIPMLLFSLARTKLFWYLIPINIPLIMIAALCLSQILKSTKRQVLCQWISCIRTIAIVIPSFHQTRRDIRPPFEDKLQIFFQQQKNLLPELQGETVYLSLLPDTVPDGGGYQKYILLAELFFDWNCQFVNVKDFLENPNAQILLISQEDYDTNYKTIKGCTEIVRDEGYMLLKKNSLFHKIGNSTL